MKQVRLYGCFVGHASAATVTEGWRKALLAHDLLHDVFSFGGSEFETREDGFNTPVAVVTDVRELPNALGRSPGHDRVHVVLALHSDWVPPSLYAMLRDPRVKVLAPSEDTKRHLLAAMKEVPVAVEVVEHGVDEGFHPITTEQAKALPYTSLGKFLYLEDHLNLVHFCESSIQRKGTVELIEAFDEFRRESGVPAMLTVVPSPLQSGQIYRAIGTKSNIRIAPRFNADASKMRFVYSCFDAIVQPSRAEGFGLVPLEGLCTGVPCLITTGHGHDQWAIEPRMRGGKALRLGTYGIRLGEPGEPEIEPAPVPTVGVGAIQNGLHRLVDFLLQMRLGAAVTCDQLRDEYAWPKVTRSWADQIKETVG